MALSTGSGSGTARRWIVCAGAPPCFERAAYTLPAAPAFHRALAAPSLRVLLERWADELNYRLIL